MEHRPIPNEIPVTGGCNNCDVRKSLLLDRPSPRLSPDEPRKYPWAITSDTSTISPQA